MELTVGGIGISIVGVVAWKLQAPHGQGWREGASVL